MDRSVTLNVSVSRGTAIAAGVPRYGDAEYVLTGADLASLAADTRLLLADALDRGVLRASGPLVIAAPIVSWDAIKPVLLVRLATLSRDREASEEAIQLRTKSIVQLRAFALGIDALARPAKDGYDVSSAVLDHIAAQVRADFAGAYVLAGGTPECDGAEWEERAAPRTPAFAVLDRVTKHVADVRCPRASWSGPRIPACVDIKVSRVVRFTPAPTRDAQDREVLGQRITAVVVTVKASAMDAMARVVVFPAES